jgi:hypothetical protein
VHIHTRSEKESTSSTSSTSSTAHPLMHGEDMRKLANVTRSGTKRKLPNSKQSQSEISHPACRKSVTKALRSFSARSKPSR